MIKIASFLLTFCFGLVITNLSSSVLAQTIDLTQYLVPTNPTKVNISSGEVFYSINNGSEIIQCKKDDCSNYQKLFVLNNGFGLQGEDYWNDGNVTRENYTFQYRLDNGEIAPWLPLSMDVGSLYKSPPLNVVGYFINPDGSTTRDPNCGSNCGHVAGVEMLLDELGPMEFLNGVKFESVAKFVVKSGPGEGEVFYYAKGVGWIGWEGRDAINLPSSSPIPYNGPATKAVFTCQPSSPINDTSRPAECAMCNKGGTTPDCATTFSVNDTVEILKKQGYECNGQYYVPKTWGGRVNVTANDVTIPFVGKQGQEDEMKYLADYFEGTDEYYRAYKDGSPYLMDKINFAGVNRKLSPMEYQNQVKAAVLARVKNTAVTNPVSDYPIRYKERVCWDLPILADVFLAFVDKIPLPGENLPIIGGIVDRFRDPFRFVAQRTHYCYYEKKDDKNNINNVELSLYSAAIDFFNDRIPKPPSFKIVSQKTGPFEAKLSEIKTHQPPKLTDPNYEKAYKNWKTEAGGKWYYLWATVPMSSREDTSGRIKSEAAKKQFDQYNIDKNSFKETYSSVPHVARLFEQASNIKKMLTNMATSVLGDKTTLLAQAPTSGGWAMSLSINPPTSSGEGYYQMYPFVHLDSVPSDCDPTLSDNGITNISFTNGSCGDIGRQITLSIGDAPKSIVGLNGCDSPRNYMRVGDSYSVSLVVDGGGYSCRTSSKPGPFSLSCTMTLTQKGFVSTCGQGSTTPPPPACGLAEAPNIPACQKPAITDTNPNDTLCCGTVRANLNAAELIINPDHTPCAEVLPDGTVRFNSDCNDPIKDIPVSRKIAVNLDQPLLKQIWDATANPISGIFNYFRPDNYPKFTPLEAKSKDKVSYEYDNGKGTGTVSPDKGDFYFPYLGGIQQAKEQTVRSLTPYKPQLNFSVFNYTVKYD